MSESDFRDRLSAFRNHLVGSEPPKTSATRPVPERAAKLAASLGGKVIAARNGSYVLVEREYSLLDTHGCVTFHETLHAPDAARHAFSVDDRPDRFDLSQVVYFDTETTGLGGAGAVAFLIGCGRLTETGFITRQFIIPDYSDEAAMLEAVMEQFDDDAILVTYNGAAFDLPIVKDRLIINRVEREVPIDDHIDLLHATRRLFKRRIKNCQLMNIEQELFGFIRENDIPGYLIPSVYFAWLNHDEIGDLIRAMDHNRHDIVSLHFLLTHLARTFHTEGEILDCTDDLFSLSRIYGRRKQLEKAITLFRRCEGESTGPLAADIRLYAGRSFKKAGEFHEAKRVWLEIAQESSREAYWANLELAKLFERELRDFPQALGCARAAARLCPYGERHQVELQRRISRLEGRLESAGL